MRLSNHDEMMKRLRRIEGQARGIQRMLEEGRPCPEVVQQLAALRAAVDRAGLALVTDNLKTCLAAAELDPQIRQQVEEGIAALGGLRA